MGKQTIDSSGPRTLAEALNFAEKFLARSGIEYPRRDAEGLLARILNIEPWQLYLDRDRRISSRETSLFRAQIARRSRREPLAYLEGQAGFYTLDLKVDRRGLIPRPESELLIYQSLRIIDQSGNHPFRALDLGCGCGNIALSLARESSALEICASDISSSAVELARENARRLGLSARVKFRVGDLLEPWEDYRERGFDLIVSNPPYVSRGEFGDLPPEVRRYEPRIALDGGRGGLEVIRRLIRKSPAYLKPGGWLIFEIGAGQSNRVKKILTGPGDFSPPEVTRDYGGHDRVIAARCLNPGSERD